MNRFRVRLAAHFLGAWITVGFAGGAGVLLLLAIPAEAWLAHNGWSHNITNLLLSFLALGWVVVSGSVSWRAARTWMGTRRIVFFHAVMLILCALFFNAFVRAGAGLFAGFRGAQTAATERFTFGPFPDRARMESLKREGYSGIVTLLSPLVPFEAVLLEEERENAAAAGLELVEASMLPWVSANLDAITTIRAVARRPSGRFYVHCYLGRHRAELARFVILEESDSTSSAVRRLPARFLRGPVVRLGETIVLGPAPTHEEWFEFVVRAGIRRVFILGDTVARPDWVVQEMGWAEAAGIDARYVPFRVAADADTILDTLRRDPAATFIHAYFVDDKLDAFTRVLDPQNAWPRFTAEEPDPVAVFLSQVDTTPISIPFVLPEKLERGAVAFDSTGRIAYGPLPTEDEWQSFFAASGVRYVISMLNPGNEEDRPWILQEQGAIEQLGAHLLVLPVTRQSELLPVLRALRALPGHVYVHAYGNDDRITGLRDLLVGARSMPETLERGPLRSPRAGVWIGPLPTPEEWQGILARAGVRSVFTLMDERDAGNRIWIDQVKAAASYAGFRLQVIGPGVDGPALRKRIDEAGSDGIVFVHAYRADDPRLRMLAGSY